VQIALKIAFGDLMVNNVMSSSTQHLGSLVKRLGAVLVAILMGCSMVGMPAQAMGSSDAFSNIQVGVTYTVYEPTFTAGLKAMHIGGNDLCPKGTEENVTARYGKSNSRQFTISEGNPMCFDIGIGATVLTTTIGNAKVVVQAYCNPASPKKCTKADVIRHGGHLEVTLPGTAGLRDTRIWIETYGVKNLSAQQLVNIARGLKPVNG
jgi:hypothetical protein